MRFSDFIHYFVMKLIRSDYRCLRPEFPIVSYCNAQDMVNFLLPTSVARQGYYYNFLLPSFRFFFSYLTAAGSND